MNGRGGRQFSRGGMGGPDPPRRRRFRGQYVRRRTPSGSYNRTGSFSDDRNDSSPPPPINRQLPPEDQQQHYHHHQHPHLQQNRNHRGAARHQRNYSDHHNRNQQDRQQFHDNQNPYQPRSQRNFDASDNEFNDQGGDHQNNSQYQRTQHAHQQASSVSNQNTAANPTRKLDELTKSYQVQKTELEEMRVMFSKLTTELDQIKTRVKEFESTGSKAQLPHQPTSKEGADIDQERDRRRKTKNLKMRERKTAKLSEKRAAAISENSSQLDVQQGAASQPQESTGHVKEGAEQQTSALNTAAGTSSKYTRRTNRERNMDKRPRFRRDFKDKTSKPLPQVNRNNNANDDSTTQAAEPSSEDRQEGEDGREGSGKERVRVFRRKKPHVNKRGPYNNRRRRAISSERNSNDTSPQGEANGADDYQERRKNKSHSNNKNKKTFPELSGDELNEIVRDLKREFLNLERPMTKIKETMNAKGPKVVYEFSLSILDHAICDVTSPTKLSEIANNLHQLLVSEDNTSEVDFQKGFYEALNDISKREDDIAIDAPRYMDTLGQLLAECIIPMNHKRKQVVRNFLKSCVQSYCAQNRAVFLSSIMKSIASVKTDRFAKEIWDAAQMDWSGIMNEGTDLNEFLAAQEVEFTTRTFSPEPRKSRKAPKELEKFADDITDMVEKQCTPQALNDLFADMNVEPEDKIDYFGTFLYAIVRGCLSQETGDYKLNNEALNKYSSILNVKHDEQDAIALHALTALTKLWQQYNCPQDLMRIILQSLHNHGTASYEALNEWLNSESLTNIPGIGSARLSSKRYIEDLGSNLKS